MADDQPIIDSELLQIEQLLRGASPAPSTQERDRVLFAAGAAAGRQQLKRQFRIVAGVAVVLALTSVSLGTVLLNRPAEMIAATEQQPDSPRTADTIRPVLRSEFDFDLSPRSDGKSLQVRDRFDFDALERRLEPSANVAAADVPVVIDTTPQLRAGSKEWFVESL